MRGPTPPEGEVSGEERSELERLVRGHTTGQQLVVRARLILAAADGLNNTPGGPHVRDCRQHRPTVARPLASRPRGAGGGDGGGGAAGGCTPLGCPGPDWAGAGLPDHRPGLPGAVGGGPPDQPVEPP